MKATVDGIVFEADTAQDLGLALASYKNGLVKQEQTTNSSNTSSAI